MKKKFLLVSLFMSVLSSFGVRAETVRVPNTNTECVSGTSQNLATNASPAVLLDPTPYPVTKDSQWKYLDDGTSLDAENWTELAFDNTSWAEGKGSLGYGDPVNTVIAYDP